MQMLTENTLAKQILTKWQVWLGALMIVTGALLIAGHFVDLSQAPAQMLTLLEETATNLATNSFEAASITATHLETTNAGLSTMMAMAFPWGHGPGQGWSDGGGAGMQPPLLPTPNPPSFGDPGGGSVGIPGGAPSMIAR